MLQDLAHTLRTRLADHPRFAAPKRPPSSFAVDHYAGLVAYASEALMDKNKDFVIAEHQSLMSNSHFPLVQCAPVRALLTGLALSGSACCWSRAGTVELQVQAACNTVQGVVCSCAACRGASAPGPGGAERVQALAQAACNVH